MQISRHWRMNSQRYRLEGVRYQNGEVSLQLRPTPRPDAQRDGDVRVQTVDAKLVVPAAR